MGNLPERQRVSSPALAGLGTAMTRTVVVVSSASLKVPPVAHDHVVPRLGRGVLPSTQEHPALGLPPIYPCTARPPGPIVTSVTNLAT